MKILQTSDWHLGSFRGPEENGVNLRSEDTINCLREMVRVAREEKPELILVSGDIFHKAEVWQGRSHKEVLQARSIILDLAELAQKVIVMRGTPNHDSIEAFDELTAHFEFLEKVEVVTTPKVISTEEYDIAVLPGFDRGIFRAKFPGLSKEEENEVFTKELSNIVFGLKAQCNPEKGRVLMSHYTVPGCNTESGQVMMLTQFEPILSLETLQAAAFDLIALGHIHRPQQVSTVQEYVEKDHYSMSLSMDIFLDDKKSHKSVDKFYKGYQKQLKLHEKKLNSMWKKATKDKKITPEESEKISERLKKVTNITNKIQKSNSDSSMEAISLKYTGAKPNLNTFVSLQKELQGVVQSEMTNYEKTFNSYISRINLMRDSGALTDNKARVMKETATQKYLNQVKNMNLVSANYQLDNVKGALGFDLDGILPEMNAKVNEVLEGALKRAKNGDMKAFDGKELLKSFEFENVTSMDRKNALRLYEAMIPTTEQMRMIAEKYVNAGKQVPEKVANYLKSAEAIGIIAGSAEAMLGLFEVKETAITHSDGHVTVNKTTKVTGKGQQYFINKFLATGVAV